MLRASPRLREKQDVRGVPTPQLPRCRGGLTPAVVEGKGEAGGCVLGTGGLTAGLAARCALRPLLLRALHAALLLPLDQGLLLLLLLLLLPLLLLQVIFTITLHRWPLRDLDRGW